MRVSRKLGLTALTTALLLCVAVGSASARNLSTSSQNIRATWSRLEFTSTFGMFTIRCQVTLEGSFHAGTIPKVARSLIGAITRALAKEESCTSGRVHPKIPPWHLTYEGFTGTLPNMSGIFLLLSRFTFEIMDPGFCTGDYGTATDNISLRAERSGTEISRLEFVSSRRSASRVSGAGSLCPPTVEVVGSEGQVAQLNTTTRISITLI